MIMFRRHDAQRANASEVWLAPDVGVDDDDDAIDAIYATFDALLCDCDFAEIDAMLAAVDVPGSTIVQLLAYASITNPAASLLRERGAYMARVREHLTEIEPHRVGELLAGWA